jgi:hypothetical protein
VFVAHRYDCWHYLEDQELQVWMRTATLTTVWKLYRKIEGDLKAGDYSLAIDPRYPVRHVCVCVFCVYVCVRERESTHLKPRDDFLANVIQDTR